MFLVKDESRQGHWVHYNIQSTERSIEKGKHRKEKHKVKSMERETIHMPRAQELSFFLFSTSSSKSFYRCTHTHSVLCSVFPYSGECVWITYEALSTNSWASPGPSPSFQFGHQLVLPGSRTGPQREIVKPLSVHLSIHSLGTWLHGAYLLKKKLTLQKPKIKYLITRAQK